MSSRQHTNTGTAPWVAIPEMDVTSIEHPCIVKNSLKAIDMLGGPSSLTQSLEQGTQQSLSLSFNPNDPASRTMLSLHNDTSNVLLKVTIPKRTGRKRKRGTEEWSVDSSLDTPRAKDAAYLVSSLRHQPENSQVEAVGNIKSCHVWRAIPDFAFYTKTSGFLRSVENHLLPQQYPLLKEWSMPRTYGLEDTEIVPPPVFSAQSLAHNYTYRQNPAVKVYADPTTGDKILLNRAAPVKLYVQTLMFDELSYPTAPLPNCPPLNEQSKLIQKLVGQLRHLFEQRPIWTRRAMINSLPLDAMDQYVKIAAAYVCFNLRSGPWRDAYVKFGLDPRTDPKYRKFQTILLKLVPRDRNILQNRGQLQRLWTRSPDTESHIFTGTKEVPIDGKTWQLCDLHDPTLKQLVDIPDLHIRAECEPRYFGWYQNGTTAKMRVLLKAKVDALAEERQLDSAMVESFLQLPEQWNPKTMLSRSTGPASGYLPEQSSNKELEWASAYRSLCRTSEGSLPNFGGSGKGRLSKPKPKSRPSFIGSGESEADNLEEDPAEKESEQDAEAAVDYEEPEEEDDELTLENEDGSRTGIELSNPTAIQGDAPLSPG